ncbi:hypothetical protein DFR70_12638 [Nocardia tenerifensis]|uniref:Uncharacterized protein n=1 Tax=Nocardia tenerifensis TaxID=228006 RepID=A0A318JNY7_9NOCA|nr:hypothetical protein [Nocardia tenerifensis]PXX53917.1 hypothetical protein DFR70_12638 [Nocardia tenerifensis]
MNDPTSHHDFGEAATPPFDPSLAPTATAVAVQAVTSGIVGPGYERTEAWRIIEIPVIALGCFDWEADAIYAALEGLSWVGDVIAVDTVYGTDGQKFEAGCSTWTRFSNSDAIYRDAEHQSPLSPRARAAGEHWNCEHALFGPGARFTARIATDDSVEPADGPAQRADIVILTDDQPDEPLAAYSCTTNPLDPIPADPAEVLDRHGWRTTGPGHLDTDGYLIVGVERA